MDIISYIRPRSKKVGSTEYENGRTYAFKSMVNIYLLFRKNYDQTRQSIYFFTYVNKMIDTCSQLDNDFARGQVDAYKETFEHFKPRRKDERCTIQD